MKFELSVQGHQGSSGNGKRICNSERMTSSIGPYCMGSDVTTDIADLEWKLNACLKRNRITYVYCVEGRAGAFVRPASSAIRSLSSGRLVFVSPFTPALPGAYMTR